MKGIILGAGNSTRLYPASLHINKLLLPVYDKPMIYYPLSTLMQAGIRDILIITSPHDKALFIKLLGDGSQWGISISYDVQTVPKGIADAFIIGEQFIGKDDVCLILGDNIIHGDSFARLLPDLSHQHNGATVYGYRVNDPERFGVLGFDAAGHVNDLLEKPKNPPSNYAVIGLYFYDNQVVEISKNLKPSARGELEITDVNRVYLDKKQLQARLIEPGTAWLDTGTHDSLLEASQFVSVLEHRLNIKVSCPEEIAWRKGYITDAELKALAEPLVKSGYGKPLLELLNHARHTTS